jgi:Methyltransferase domain
MELVPAQDRINRTAWRTRSARYCYGSASDWTDPGEAAAIAWVADKVRDQPLLDVGVGGGRTVPFLTRISNDCTAVDYTPELVEICRRNHPLPSQSSWCPGASHGCSQHGDIRRQRLRAGDLQFQRH